MPTLNTLYDFGLDPSKSGGLDPAAGLFIDTQGNLFGTTQFGGFFGSNFGTVFELQNGPTGYSTNGVPNFGILKSFGDTDGANPVAGLSTGDGGMWVTAFNGGSSDDGTLTEVSASGFVFNFPSQFPFSLLVPTLGTHPAAGVTFDLQGDMFGTAEFGGAGGANDGTVYEFINTASGFWPQLVYSFGGGDGANPVAGLIVDGQGNLFGTTQNGGDGFGTVFELVPTSTKSVLTGFGFIDEVQYSFKALHNFSDKDGDGANPAAGLIADAQGNLFGTTKFGGTFGQGTVFELVKTSTGYIENVLYSFAGGTDGAQPVAGLIIDAQGDLFGTTSAGGGSPGGGTVFELVNTGTGYKEHLLASFQFNGTDGSTPLGGLVHDAQGNLFGTTSIGGTGHVGTVFEIADSGFLLAPLPSPVMLDAVYNPATNLTTLNGTAEPNSTVSVFDNVTKLVGTAVAGSDGKWSLDATVTGGAKGGTVVHSFTETSVDSVGHQLSSAGVALFAQAAKQSLQAGSTNDVLIGAPNDTLTGGDGANTFVFNPGFGKETITDFGKNLNQNVIAFAQSLFPGGADQVLSQAHDTSAGAVIVVDANDTVTLVGVTVAQLQSHAGDIHFF